MHPKHWDLVRTGVGIFGFVLAAVMRSRNWDLATLWPVVAIFATVFVIVSCADGYFYLQRHQYRDHIYDPLQPGDLTNAQATLWEQYTEQWELLGFRTQGDYVLDRGFPAMYARFAYSDDQRIRANVCSVSDGATPSFVTCFEDGRLIESGLNAVVETCCHPDQNLWFIVLHQGTVFELFDTHRRAIDAYTRETGSEALAITPERNFEFVQYAHRLLWWEKYHKPSHLGPPEPPRKVRELLPASANSLCYGATS